MACDDVTAPVRHAIGPRAVLPGASASAPVVVWPDSLHGWAFAQTRKGKPCAELPGCGFVMGPDSPPLGRGSAELVSDEESATRLTLNAFHGTRLDRLTSLGYATYRQSEDRENDASVTLQLTVQYDVAEGAEKDVGHLIHEPSLGVPGRVMRGRWRSWNALEGLWWSDRRARQSIHGAGAHPCVRARPCTWAMVLARFPNIAIHPEAGAISFGAPRDDFRGNVDSLSIGIGGQVTTFDFERERRRTVYPLSKTVGDGVIADRFPVDTLFPEGATVPYAFSSRPGRAAPLVILDDTLVLQPSGTIVMNARHSVSVVSDTIYSYATLTPMERTIADLTGTLLTGADKVGAAQAINAYLVDRVNGGMSGEAVARAARVAQHVVIDPERDAVALAAVDAALSGQSFHYQDAGYNGPGQMTTWTSRGWPSLPSRTVAPASGAPWSVSRSSEAAAADRSALSSPLGGGAARDIGVIDDANNPREYTRIVYTNGIETLPADAFSSALLLASLVYAEPRFHNYYTGVTLHYNPTHSVQMRAFDSAHPCVRPFLELSGFASFPQRLLAYAACKRISYVNAFTSMDLVEAVGARIAFELALPPTNDEVLSLARETAAYRAGGTHVILVGHSEGVILQAAAVQQLPALEQHPLQAANRCVGVLALAPPTRRASYGMDEFHLKGLLAEHDIIRLTLPSGWEDVSTPLSREATDSIMSGIRFPAIYVIDYGVRIHGVIETYLTGNVAPVVQARLATLHRECIPGSASLDLSSAVVPLQQSVTAILNVANQNRRPLLGRTPTMGRYSYFFDRTDSMTFRAMTPYDGQLRISADVTPGLDVSAPVRIPLVRPDFTIRETQLWEWVPVGAANGAGGTGSQVAVPTDPWSGAPGDCGRHVTNAGAAGNTVTYELRCNRSYTPVYLNADTLITGRRIVGTRWYFTTPQGVTAVGPSTYYFCPGATPCIASGYLELLGALGVVGRSTVVTPAVSASGAVTPISAPVISIPLMSQAAAPRGS